MFALFPSKISADAYGGPENLFRALMELGMIHSSCDACNSTDLALSFDTPDSFPRARCKGCGYRCRSLRHGSIFEEHGINNIPGFLFVAGCFT